MDIVLIVIAFLLVIIGIAGCILPALPGPPLAYGGLLLLYLTGQVTFSTAQLISWLVLIIILQVLDYLTPMLGSKYSGGSEYGNRGCIAGTLVGMFFMPWGIIAGPFMGAVIGELLGGNDFPHALRAGIGSFIGFVFSVLLKLFLCFYFLYQLIVAL